MVTCPTMRIHPAIVAQAAATTRGACRPLQPRRTHRRDPEPAHGRCEGAGDASWTTVRVRELRERLKLPGNDPMAHASRPFIRPQQRRRADRRCDASLRDGGRATPRRCRISRRFACPVFEGRMRSDTRTRVIHEELGRRGIRPHAAPAYCRSRECAQQHRRGHVSRSTRCPLGAKTASGRRAAASVMTTDESVPRPPGPLVSYAGFRDAQASRC